MHKRSFIEYLKKQKLEKKSENQWIFDVAAITNWLENRNIMKKNDEWTQAQCAQLNGHAFPSTLFFTKWFSFSQKQFITSCLYPNQYSFTKPFSIHTRATIERMFFSGLCVSVCFIIFLFVFFDCWIVIGAGNVLALSLYVIFLRPFLSRFCYELKFQLISQAHRWMEYVQNTHGSREIFFKDKPIRFELHFLPYGRMMERKNN